MTLRRTAKGLSNQHLFLNVDTIVFVEGGTSYSKEEVYNGDYDASAIDITFWKELFSIYQTSKKLYFRGVGSKYTLRSIAEDIKNGKINNVYVAMDRDFDALYERLVHADGVIYTYGYSWENDVWHPEVVQDVFCALCLSCPTPYLDDILKKIANMLDKFVSDIKIAVFADAMLGKSGVALIPRDNKHMSCLKWEKGIGPCINSDKVDELLKLVSVPIEEVQHFGNALQVHPQKDCYGHLLADYCYHLIKYFLKYYTKLPPIAKLHVFSFGIDKFSSRLTNNQLPKVYSYYEKCFSSLGEISSKD